MPVESNGIFDPALLLTLPSLRTHIVNAAGEMTMVDSLSLDVRIGGAETITTVHVDRLTNDMPTRSFSIYRCNGVFCALYQSISNNALSTSRGKILSVRIRWVANGQVRELLTPDAAAGAVRTVMF